MPTRRQREYLEIIAKREQAVKRKMQRLARKGVKAEGTEVDPRRTDVGNMTARQMGQYVKRLDQFVDRKTQFVPGVSGTPLPAAKWREFKRRENIANQVSIAYRKKIENVHVPSKGMTMGEYREMKRGNLPSRLIPSVNDAFDVRGRISYGVPNEKALDKLIQQEKARAQPSNFKNWQKSNREAARKMLTHLNEKDLAKRLDKLTDAQFHLMWESGASEVALAYVISQSAFESGEDEPAWWQQRSGDELGEVRELAEWASSVDLGDDGKVDTRKRPSKPRKPRAPRAPRHPNGVDLYTDTRAKPINIWTDTKAGPIDLP